ncbi:MAG: DUF2156 domain-containing protein [Desulfovibrionaceae bacterium]
MQLEFTPISTDRQKEYNAILSSCPQIPTSDYAFANIWGWAEHYGLEWAFGEGLAWVRQTIPETVYWAPLGPWDNYRWTECPIMRAAGHFTRVPEYLAELWNTAFQDDAEIAPSRDHWDYIYSVPDLVELGGNQFHKKKNLLNQFLKKYDFTYSPMGPDCVEEVLVMQAEWLKWFEDNNPIPALLAENVAITRVLQCWDQIGTLRGAAIRVRGKVVAYTVAEPVGTDSVVIHFEKGNTAFKGVYQAMNQMFLEHDAKGIPYVNREQDLGDEGLRKAKMSYNPVFFLKKFEARIR